MSKPRLRLKARRMRSKGESVNKIAKQLKVSKSTASIWVRDIVLTTEQLEKLRQMSIKGGESGRLKGSLKQKSNRLERLREGKQWGHMKASQLNDSQRFFIGAALYWAKGSKKSQQIHVHSSDPDLINIMLMWFTKYFDISKKDIRLWVGINEIHRPREHKVKKYWSEKTGVPLRQFNATSYKRAKNTKVHENHNNHFGTLNIKILKPVRFYYKITGLIDGLARHASTIG